MKYEKQRRLRDELNARFPREAGNIGQQTFRSCYYNARMHGFEIAEAIRISIDAVRRYVPDFTPVEV